MSHAEHPRRTTPARRVIEKFGGQKRLADMLGKGQSTVAYWAKTGNIPTKWHAKLLELAEAHRIALTPSELVALPALPEPAELPTARYEGELPLGTADVHCYVLSNGQRVISRTSAATALSGIRHGGDLESYVGAEPLRPYLRTNLKDDLVHFRLTGVDHKNVAGLSAETFLEICKAYQAAANDNALKTDRQRAIARQAGSFLAACSYVGITALIDEATGYQYERAEDALRVKLRAYLEDEMRPWEKTFPDQLWVEFGRLTGWEGAIHNRPKWWGKLVNELVYDCLDGDVAQWLRDNAPAPRHGQNYHQWLTSQYGLKKLLEHIWMLIGMASACRDMDELRYRMALKYGKHQVQLRLYIDPPE